MDRRSELHAHFLIACRELFIFTTMLLVSMTMFLMTMFLMAVFLMTVFLMAMLLVSVFLVPVFLVAMLLVPELLVAMLLMSMFLTSMAVVSLSMTDMLMTMSVSVVNSHSMLVSVPMTGLLDHLDTSKDRSMTHCFAKTGAIVARMAMRAKNTKVLDNMMGT